MDNNEPNDPTSAADGDGSTNNGTSVRTVPEADLIALKQSLESKLGEKDTELATANATLETERADHKSVEEKAGKVDGLAVEIDDLKTKLATAESATQTLVSQNLEDVKKKLVSEYRLPQDKVDNLNLEQARMFLDTLPTPTAIPSPANLDMQSGSTGGDNSTLSAREKIRQGISG